MATVAPLASISLTARKIVAVNEDTAAYVSGNCVAFLSLSTEMRFFSSLSVHIVPKMYMYKVRVDDDDMKNSLAIEF